jgi:hypothetical protein
MIGFANADEANMETPSKARQANVRCIDPSGCGRQ